jgi:hypothetical protein
MNKETRQVLENIMSEAEGTMVSPLCKLEI